MASLLGSGCFWAISCSSNRPARVSAAICGPAAKLCASSSKMNKVKVLGMVPGFRSRRYSILTLARMEKRKLGHSDLMVAPWAFGGNVFGWTVDEQGCFRLLDAFLEKGFNLIDTADSYPRWVEGNVGGESETMIGNWLHARGNRHKVVIATKVGSDMGEGRNLRKAYILRAVEQSLKRLRTDHIDLYQTHWDDLETPVEETLSAMDQLVRSGKVRWIGASNLGPGRLEHSMQVARDLGLPAYVSLQPRYNLFSRHSFEEEYAPICGQHGLGVLTYYSLASGFLTGKYRSSGDLGKSVRGSGMESFLKPRGQRILQALDAVSERHGCKQATVALAWLISRPLVTAPIASATTLGQLEELAAAADLRLTAADLAELDEASGVEE